MKNNADLYQDIIDKLEFDPSLDASDIAIRVEDGVVVLEGKVSTLWEKHIAEYEVKKVFGVKGVANELQVQLSKDLHRSDADIAHSAVSALNWNSLIPKNHIQVSVENRDITLSGNVKWKFQKDEAEKTIRTIIGIKKLNNYIQLQPDILPSDIKNRIKKEFHRNAQLDADKIQVEIDGSEITLRGNVKSWAEIDEAENAAWATPGIMVVNNQLKIN